MNCCPNRIRRNDIYIFPKNIVTMNGNLDVLQDTGIEVRNGTIKRYIKRNEVIPEGEKVFSFPDYILLPGFIQTHVHLCQTLFRGLAEDLPLLDWLSKRIFPYENNHNRKSLEISAKIGLCELQKTGTTAIMDMGTMRHQEVIFDEMIKSGMRGFAGKCMIDTNGLYPSFCEPYEDSLKTSIEFAKTYHNSNNGRIKYAFAPRFVLSCTEKLLKETYSALSDFEGSIFHSHSSENKQEVEEVRRITGKENIEYFNSIGVLGERTVFAHCIHLNENEIELIRSKKAKIAHCPSSNLKLGSGVADIPGYLKKGINVSLGADGAPCNNNLSCLNEMRLASLIQKPKYGSAAMSAQEVIKMATINAAEALGIANETGSIEPGKKADLLLMDLNGINNPLNDVDIYSSIVYSADVTNIKEVMIEGEWVISNGESVIYNEQELVAEGKEELKKLIERTNTR